MLPVRLGVVPVLLFALAGVACDRGTGPVSPTTDASPASASQVAGATAGSANAADATFIALTGVVRSLDAEAHSFTLMTRTGVRVIRTDDRTEVRNGNQRVRLNAVREGAVVAVRAQDCGSYALARTISITR